MGVRRGAGPGQGREGGGAAGADAPPAEWLAGAFEDAPALIAVHHGPQHRFVFANRMFREHSDGRRLIGLPYAEAFPEFVAQGYLDILDRVLRTGAPFHARGARADTARVPGGPIEERYWDFTFQAVRGPGGAVEGTLSCSFEVTDPILAARRANRERQRYDDLIGAVGAIVWSVRPEDWRPTWVGGPAALEGFDGDPLEPARFLAALDPADRPRLVAARGRLRAPGDRYEEEVRWCTADGQRRWLEESGRLVEEDQGARVVWGFTRDVTQRRQAQEEHARLEAQLVDVQRLEGLGLLAGGIAHDFNNLLTAILGNASLAAAEIGPGGAGARALGALVAAAERAGDLTRQLLAFSGRGHFLSAPVDLNAVARDLVGLLRTTVPPRVDLRLQLASALPAVLADRSQMDQILMNLILNAAEAIGEGAGRVVVRTGQRWVDSAEVAPGAPFEGLVPGPVVWLEVEDDGRGMEPATRARVFEPFFSHKGPGRGLGLAAVQGIVRGHRGVARVESEPGRGSRFTVLLPLAEADAPRADPVSPGPTRSGARLVLVVDDEDGVRAVARAALEYGGFEVLEARDGLEGVELVRAHGEAIALVLMDLTMPRMGGAEARRALLALRPELPVLLMSGFAHARAEAGAAPADFLPKPYTVDQLLHAVGARLGPLPR